jgi:quercetin dioxygenase-like cupin family protein
MARRNSRGTLGAALLALSLAGVFAGTALATPASQFVGTALARGTMDAPYQRNLGDVKFQTKGAVVFNVVSVNVAAGGSSGWHSHPGLVLVTVKQGAITFYDQSCNAVVHPTGTTFIEAEGDGPGLARNEGSVEAIVYVTYIAPADTTAFRLDQGNPGCPQS